MSETKIELLRDAERRSHTWIEKSPICTKIVDLDFNLQYMSSAGVKGLCISDITTYYGKPYPLEFYPQLFREEMIKNIKCARDTGETVTQEAAVTNIDGMKIWFHSTIVPVYDESNQLEYFMIVSIDITARKSAEIKLQKLNDELETLVINRTLKLEEANNQLKINSETDFLTKLSNRRFYERRLNENIATAKRNGSYLSLLMIDVDNFKEYNDKYGHDIGDIALKNIAKCISNSLHRDTDLASRFGGEEFVVLLPTTDTEIAFTIAEKIRLNVKELDLKHTQSETGIVTVSIGIEAMKGNKLNKNKLLKHSDIALYAAKNSGKNCSYIYTD
jgi:diguanylate cyclase (GGDEF)-like protein/PAS domain S-box-containing protein